jgi:probable HAF family extracellular repeat protein
MTSTAHTIGRVSGRLRLAVAGAVVLTALSAASATAAPTLMGEHADARPRSPTPGFLLDRGRYLTLEVPGATVETAAGGINNRGQIVGGARGGGVPDRGFLRDARGRYSTFRYPGARSTLAQKINDRGQLTGLYSTTTDDPRDGADLAGFLREARGRYTRIAVPGARTTTAVGINNRTQVVGQYQDANGRYHGYLWERGRFTTIDAPGAVDTTLLDINDRGQIVGARLEPDGTFRGFVLDRGRFRTVAAPGAAATFLFDINNRGQIVGASTRALPSDTAQGFLLARGVDGPFTPVSVPGAPSTVPLGLNDRGQISGAYTNPNSPSGPQRAGTPPMGRMA